MKRYMVTFAETIYYSKEIEAESKEEAEKIAEDLDINCFNVEDSETVESFNATEI